MENNVPNEIKEEFNDIVAVKDIKKFREFLDTNGDYMTPVMREKLKTLDDDQILGVMTYWAATQDVFTPHWEVNRNIIRSQELDQNLHLATEDLKRYISNNNDEYPTCVDCRWLRDAPPDEENSCMKLGSLPTDVACAGWTKLGGQDELQRISQKSGSETGCDVSES